MDRCGTQSGQIYVNEIKQRHIKMNSSRPIITGICED